MLTESRIKPYDNAEIKEIEAEMAKTQKNKVKRLSESYRS